MPPASSLEADILTITAAHDAATYWSGNGRDRPPEEDGNGFDCSGWDHYLGEMLAALGHYDGRYPLPLGSTSTYSKAARLNGWLIDLSEVRAGDTVIYAENGQPENSDGAAGHVGRIVRTEQRADSIWALTSESRGGQGVGLYWRRLDFWTIAYRIPDPLEDDDMFTDADRQTLLELKAFADEIKTTTPKPTDPPHYGMAQRVKDIHAVVTAVVRDGFGRNSGAATDAQALAGIRRLRKNVFEVLKLARAAAGVDPSVSAASTEGP